MTGVQTCALPICFPVTIGVYLFEPEKGKVRGSFEWEDGNRFGNVVFRPRPDGRWLVSYYPSQDPTQLVQRAGVAQTPMDGDADSQKAWLAPYFALTKDPELISELQAMAALKSSRLGGDLAYLYLRPSAQSNGAPALASTALPALRE